MKTASAESRIQIQYKLQSTPLLTVNKAKNENELVAMHSDV